MIDKKNELSNSRSEAWRARWQHLRAGVRRTSPFAAGVLAALAGLVLYNILFPGPHQLTKKELNNTIAETLASATPPPAFSERVYQVIQPSLILIQTHGTDENGLGSGVIIDDAGDILTSLHVVADATEIQITYADGTKSGAKVTTSQPENDIAVLSPDRLPAQLVPAVLGNPNAMQVGDDAFVVGNPFGLYSSMSAGVISGFDRSFQPATSKQVLRGLIQIDAAVNPGNSGGPLLNRDGEVIGIVTGIVNPTDQNFFIGIGFAVPITVAGGAFGSPPY
jgi:S1-C subfamily serine protease